MCYEVSVLSSVDRTGSAHPYDLSMGTVTYPMQSPSVSPTPATVTRQSVSRGKGGLAGGDAEDLES